MLNGEFFFVSFGGDTCFEKIDNSKHQCVTSASPGFCVINKLA